MQMTVKRKAMIHNMFLWGMSLIALLSLGIGLLGIVYAEGETFVKACILFGVSTLWLWVFFFANADEKEEDNGESSRA